MNKAMYQRIRESKDKEGGFTLIELLIVIVILGILAAVVIFASAGFKNKGAAESCKTTIASVKTAVEGFHTDSPTALYPAAYADLAPYIDSNGITSAVAGGVTTVTGKGWAFTVTFDTTGPADNPPVWPAVTGCP